jgi:hypothetical protein
MVGFNILSTQPVQITDQINAHATLTSELKYGFLAGAISTWTYSHGPAAHAHIAPYASIDFAQLMYQDISADGILDGKGIDGTGGLVQLSFGSTPLNADAYRLGIGAGMIQMAANARNKSSIAVGDVKDFATTYLGSTDAMFNGVAPVVLVAPKITIATPSANSVVNGLLNIAAKTNSVVGVAKVELLVNDVPKVTATNLADPAFQIDTNGYGDGIYTISLVATDLTGKVTTSPVSITINNTKPAVSISTPKANDKAVGLLTVSATTDSNAGLTKVELIVDDRSIATATSLAAPTFSFDTTAYRDGVHTIGVQATSTGGLVSISSVQVTFLNNPPVVAVSAPAANGWLRGAAAAITATATSANTLTSVEFLVDGSSVGFAGNLAAPAYALDTTALTEGTHTVIVRATDNLGLVTSTASRTFRVDNTPPTARVFLNSIPGANTNICVSDNLSGPGSVTNRASGVVATYIGVETADNTVLGTPSGCATGVSYWRIQLAFGDNNLLSACDVAGNCNCYHVDFTTAAPPTTACQ